MRTADTATQPFLFPLGRKHSSEMGKGEEWEERGMMEDVLGVLALVFALVLCVAVFFNRQNQRITPEYWFFSRTRCDWCACASASSG